MIDIVVGAVLVILFVAAALVVMGMRSPDEDEELAGLITANWDEVEARIGGAEAGGDGEGDSP